MRRILVLILIALMLTTNAAASESDLDGDGQTDDVDDNIDGDSFNNTNDSCPLFLELLQYSNLVAQTTTRMVFQTI